jgi:hypothetical protein
MRHANYRIMGGFNLSTIIDNEVEARNHSRNGANPKSQMSRTIFNN